MALLSPLGSSCLSSCRTPPKDISIQDSYHSIPHTIRTMSSDFDPTNATPWSGTPGLYAIFNLDGQTALDEDRDSKPPVIHGWSVWMHLQDWSTLTALMQGVR